MGNETHRVKLNLLENVCLSLLGMSHSETQYSRFSSLLGKALTVATACEQWLWRFLSRDAAEVEAWAIYHCYESYHGTLQRVLNNKCSVPLHATQIYRTYIIQVFLLNLSVASSVELLQYVFESQQQSIQLSFWGLLGIWWSHFWHSAHKSLSLLIVLFYVEMKWL